MDTVKVRGIEKKKKKNYAGRQRQPPEDVLKRAIAYSSEVIRKKYQALKTGQSERDAQLEKNLAPIVEPLRQLINEKTTQHDQISVDEKEQVTPSSSLLPAKRKIAYAKAATSTSAPPRKRVKVDEIVNHPGPSGIEDVTPLRQPVESRGRVIDYDDDDEDDEEDANDYDDDGDDDGVGNNGVVESPQPELTSPDMQLALLHKIKTQMGAISRKAFSSFVLNRNKVDTVYGVRLYNNKKWMIGDKEMKISDDDTFKLSDPDAPFDEGMAFKITPGLMDLIMYKRPNRESQTLKDLEDCKKILIYSNAHRRLWKKDGQMKGSTSWKWKNIISNLFYDIADKENETDAVEGSSNVEGRPAAGSAKGDAKKKKKSGGSIPTSMIVTNNEVDYIPWRDPNALVDRLELLIAEREAGNTSHNNEIIAIASALRRAEIIE